MLLLVSCVFRAIPRERSGGLCLVVSQGVTGRLIIQMVLDWP